MDLERKKPSLLDVTGFIEGGTQFDLDITLPEDRRDVIFGIVKDCHHCPVEDAVVKLVEVCKGERKPVSHTFTDKNGEFVFGPLCPDRSYEILIWVNKVKHFKICRVCNRQGACLKGVDMDCDKEAECVELCEPEPCK